MGVRKKLLYLVESPDEVDAENDSFDCYDIFMMLAIIVSIIPLAIKTNNAFFYY